MFVAAQYLYQDFSKMKWHFPHEISHFPIKDVGGGHAGMHNLECTAVQIRGEICECHCTNGH